MHRVCLATKFNASHITRRFTLSSKAETQEKQPLLVLLPGRLAHAARSDSAGGASTIKSTERPNRREQYATDLGGLRGYALLTHYQ